MASLTLIVYRGTDRLHILTLINLCIKLEVPKSDMPSTQCETAS